ncbi:MAG TPA: alpha/beta hydrolase domain-containing protein, partial [Chloroflexota bacterium]|nr:alpha/beta hydrolase domain-containing protein [Chloroflexota bacterium]
MSVHRLEILSRTPFAGGTPFGDAGVYERIDGLLHFAVDPEHPLNSGIVDLDKAPRDDEGRVQFTADFCLLQPVDEAKGNGRLLYEVSNRGRRGALSRFNRPRPSGSTLEQEHADEETGGIGVGDGLLLRQGWTIAWCGWQWDVLRERGLLAFDAPQALQDGQPIQGQVMLQFQLDAPTKDHLLADRIHHPYPAADVHDPDAVLDVQEWPDAPRTTIPREHWRFARDEAGRPVADDTHVWLAEGFVPGKIYTLRYRTRLCPVVGTGLLAVRDCVSFLRCGTAGDGNPCAGRLQHTFGFGSSQSGRFLRTFLHLGLNVDEQRRQVFDGLLINVAGARRGEFNHRYAQPSVIPAHSFGHLPPFGFDGLLERQRERGGVPKIFATNTASEYWNRAASLIHTDLLGEGDVEPPPDVRVYLFSSTKHASGAPPSKGTVNYPVQMPNVLDFAPLLRATFFNLVDWVTAEQEPPPSAYPK